MSNIVIGIEGLVGAGKTTICRALLNKIPNSILLHGGNLYRAIVYAFMQAKKEEIDLSNLKSNLQNVNIKQIMDKLKIRLEIENRETVVYVGDTKIEEEKIQSQEASLAVSIASRSANSAGLYEFGKGFIDTYKSKFNVIVSGRDLMNIYPDLDYHFFITASLDERVKRKYIQYNDTVKSAKEIEKIKENIMQRDKLQEESGYYKKYEKTIEIDVTDCKSAEESAQKLMNFIKF